MKQDILKIAGVKSEADFYKKFPTEEAFMKVHGEAFKKAKMGASMVKKQLVQLTDFSNPPKAEFGQKFNTWANSINDKVDAFNDQYGEQISKGLGLTSTIGKNVMKISDAVAQKKSAKQSAALSEPVAQAAMSRSEQPRRRYVRPEENLLNPNETINPYGTGYDVLAMAQNGMQIGGNLTEIQNMYNPGTLYNDLGYEPLDESSKVKQFQGGGALGFINEGLNLAGDLTAMIIGAGTKKYEKQTQKNLQEAALHQGTQAMQDQYSAYMENGGWVSNDWQPQVIAKFGEYDVKDLLAPPNDADMLRAGGNVRDIRSNYMGDDEKISMMPMGGQLKTHWGGDTELMSYNPYMPGNGETYMATGNYHSESDGTGKTGIGMSYGDSMVEVENGEPIIEMEEGGQMGDNSAVVFGNLKIPSYIASELGDFKGQTFKTSVKKLSKDEAKQNKIMNKGVNLVDSVDSDNSFDLLTFGSGKAMMTGADMTLQKLAAKKKFLAGAQQALHEAADKFGCDVEAFVNKGKIVQAKSGANLSSAQKGKKVSRPKPSMQTLPFITDVNSDELVNSQFWEENKPIPVPKKISVPDVSKFKFTPPDAPDTDSSKTDYLKTAYNELLPYIRPTNQMPLDPSQLMGEMYALSTNPLQAVQAQSYQPLLETRAAKMSAQAILNQNQADFNAMARQLGNNPAALSSLAAQKQKADQQAIAQIEAANLQQEAATNARNIATLNDKTLKNLAIYDTQYQRQNAADSITKATAREALGSIASKIGQNKLENLTSGVMQNMYNYRFGPKGRIYNVNPLAEFTIPDITKLDAETIKAIEKQTGKKVTKEARNGAIVKAIKNL